MNSKERKDKILETLPSPPILSKAKKTIVFHGVLYHFPAFDDDQLDGIKTSMEEVNASFKYSMLESLLTRLAPFRLRLAKRRIPGKMIEKDGFTIAKNS